MKTTKRIEYRREINIREKKMSKNKKNHDKNYFHGKRFTEHSNIFFLHFGTRRLQISFSSSNVGAM